MLSTKILAATAVAMITIGTMAIGAADANAATMKPQHHVLVCKAGSVAHLLKVKVHGKWHRVWKCARIHHHHHHHHMAPKAKAKTY
jgi:hypothetical protein